MKKKSFNKKKKDLFCPPFFFFDDERKTFEKRLREMRWWHILRWKIEKKVMSIDDSWEIHWETCRWKRQKKSRKIEKKISLVGRCLHISRATKIADFLEVFSSFTKRAFSSIKRNVCSRESSAPSSGSFEFPFFWRKIKADEIVKRQNNISSPHKNRSWKKKNSNGKKICRFAKRNIYKQTNKKKTNEEIWK